MVKSPLEQARQETARFAAHLARLSNREIAALARLSPAVHFATCVRIFNKANELIRPVPNILQLRISAAFEAFEAIGVPLRAVVCKPRQTGGSTFVGHVGQVWCKRKRIDGLTVSDVAKNSAHLVGRIQEYDSHDRFPWGVTFKATADKIDFTNGSVMAIGTAENMKEGIGRTRQWFHASEVGKWPKTTVKNDMKIMAAILPSVPKAAGNEPVFSVVFAESTPEGATGWMATTYRGAVTLETALEALADGRAIPGNGWVKIFAAWHEFEEHTIEAVSGRKLTPPEIIEIQRTLTDREREGIERYAWTWEQVAWRRFMIENECGGDEERFDEYYPEDDVRCWLTSGRPRFNVGRLEQMRRSAEGVRPQYVKLGDMGSDGVAVTRVGGVGECDALVFEEPREGMAYVLSLDPATGASQTHGKDPDAHSAQVWRRGYRDENGEKHRHKLVARLVPGCRWDVDQAAVAVACLSKWYGNCLVMLETNMGGGFLELFKLMGVPMYEREVIDPRSPNRAKPLLQIGWKLTDKEQRNSLIECLATAIRMDDIEVPCVEWIRQAQAFVVDETGKAAARAGSHDDEVMAGAMGVYGLPNATVLTGMVRKRRKPRDWDKWRPVGGARRNGGRGNRW